MTRATSEAKRSRGGGPNGDQHCLAVGDGVSDSSPGRASPREVFERARRSVIACDANGFANLFAPDGIMEFPFGGAAVGLPECLEGREQIRQHLLTALGRAKQSGRRPVAYDALMLHETSDPELLIAEFDLQGEVASTGETYLVPYVQVFRIRDGQIVSMRDYFPGDRLAALVKLAAAAVEVAG